MSKNILTDNIFLLRILTSIIFASIALIAIIYAGFFLLIFVSILLILMSVEWIKITENKLDNNLFIFKILSNLFCFLLAYYNFYAGLFSVFLIAILFSLFNKSANLNKIYIFMGPIYICTPIILLLHIRLGHVYGMEILLWCVLVTCSTDIFSYLGGKIIGGYSLCKSVSPNKTWSGFFVGIIMSVIISFIFLKYSGFYTNSVLLWSLLLSVSVQVGDLFESLIKRKHNIKDSGKLLPGHGGILDGVDGFLFCAVFTYLGVFLYEFV